MIYYSESECNERDDYLNALLELLIDVYLEAKSEASYEGGGANDEEGREANDNECSLPKM